MIRSPETLEQMRDDIVRHLTRGATSRKSPMHTLVVGTADGDLRVMVLREFDSETNTLRFHTDARSPKIAAVRANGAVGVLAYDAEAKVQIRMHGVGRIEHMTPYADARWEESTTFARRCYLAQDAPGTEREEPISGLPPEVEGITPTEDQVAPARSNFAVLLIEVQEMDCLTLANSGHRRARLFAGDSGQDCWVVP